MTIYFNTLKRIFRSKVQLIFILLLPLAFMSIALIDDDKRIRISIIDQDQTPLTEMLISSLASKANLIAPISEDQIEEQLMKLNVEYVVQIEEGFTNQLLQGGQPVIRTYSVAESNIALPIREYVSQWIQDAMVIARVVNYDPFVFYAEFETYQQAGDTSFVKRSITDEGRGKPRIALGYLAMAMLYTSLICALVIILNRSNYTLYRTLMAPVKMSRYLFQMIASLLLHSSKEIATIAEVKERNRIARELHDSIGNSLAGILIQLQAAQKLFDKDVPRAQGMMQKSIDGLAETIELLRNTVHNIKPQQNTGIGYIHSIIENYTFAPIDFKMSGDFNAIPANHLQMIGMTIKEALTNTSRYSKATHVQIAIDVHDQFTRLYIKDNGIGCKKIKEGLGLSGMRERVRNIGGHISISGED